MNRLDRGVRSGYFEKNEDGEIDVVGKRAAKSA